MSFLVLLRHGESESNICGILSSDLEGYPLTDKGRIQAARCSHEMRGLRFGGIFTSPVQRARETAGIIAGEIGIAPKVDQRLIETAMGKLNNTSAKDAIRADRIRAGSESWESQARRMREFMAGISENTIAVSHAMPIRALVSSIMEMDEIESFGIEIGFVSITVIDVGSERVESIGARSITPRLRSILSGGRSEGGA
ncbi:MAG: histidine phosphatase family protein [Candidatus Thermoplasmatota archaeon]|jgi:probable phosphoglycerate mutase|nr:histidine phosphatase family protein [Candidatus Thermoplasmatota archaeon]